MASLSIANFRYFEKIFSSYNPADLVKIENAGIRVETNESEPNTINNTNDQTFNAGSIAASFSMNAFDE